MTDTVTDGAMKTVDPGQVYALVVGVETYQLGSDCDLDGPARDGLRFIEWLLLRGVAPGHVRFFVSPLAHNADVESQAIALGIQPRSATRDAIDTYIRNELITEQMGGDGLYVFWGGHGILTTAHSTDRRLLFADTTDTSKLNLNVNSLVQALGTSTRGTGFERQIFLIDACANAYFQGLYETVQGEAAGHGYGVTQTQSRAEQFVLFAAEEYEVAKNSFFSEAVLAELQSQPLWPDMKAVAERVQVSLRSQGRPEPIYSWTKDRLSEEIVHQAQRTKALMKTVKRSDLSAVKQRVLEKRLKMLEAQYEALNEQYDNCLDTGMQVVLESKIEKLETKLAALEVEVSQLN